MKYRVLVDAGADSDMAEACLWYETREAGLNDYFVDSFRNLALRLEESAGRYPVVYKQFRKAKMDHFPFVVHFQLIKDSAIIFAVTHTSRDERVWKKRLRDRSKRR